MSRIVLRCLLTVLGLLAATTGSLHQGAIAQANWPEHPVRLLVTFPPGSANDAAARIFADALGKRWGKPVVVENRTGAEGSIGVAAFVATHDDHTVLYTVAGSITVAPLILDKLPYDVDRDLVPIVATTSIILTVAVAGGMQVQTLADLVRVAHANPGKFAWASGPTLPRYAFAAFLKRNNLEMNYVTYRDAAQPQADLGEGRIQVLVTSLQASLSPVQSGKARFLAVANSTRAAAFPEVPTAREAGYPELVIDGVAGLFGWRGMAEALRDRIAADVTAVAADPDVRRRLEATGQNVLGGTSAEFGAAIADQRARIMEIAKLVDLKNAK